MALGQYRVIEIGSLPAAAYCARLLADFGAEVIKIEPSAGDALRREPPFLQAGAHQESAWFGYLNYNKKSVTLDCTAPADAVRLQQLLSGADVLIDGLNRHERSACGLNRDELQRQHPHLVIANVEWFGESGPYRDFAGTDAICRALAGLVKVVGPAEGPPLALPDYQSAVVGGLAAYIPVVAALISRLNGDEGRAFEVSVLEANVTAMELQVAQLPADGVERRLGINSYSASGGMGIFPCKQGWIGITTNTLQQWSALCELMGRPELGNDPQFLFGVNRGTNRQKLQPVFGAVLLQRTAAEWFEEALRLKLPFAIVPGMAELLQTEVLRQRGAIVPIQMGDRTAEAPGSPLHLTATRPLHGGRVPNAGEHTALVLEAGPRAAPPRGQRASSAGHTRSRPLEGLRIIDLSMGWAGPLTGRNMADLGADVIKVEACQYPDWWRGLDKDPDAIERVLYEKSERFNFLQRGKRGITLDLTSAEGVRLLKELVKTADALIENNSAGVLRKLGLEYPRLAEVNPSIVMMSMSAYGSSGPWSDLRAYGSTLEQGSGLPCMAGYDGGLPVQTHPAGGDPMGGWNGSAALLTALLHRKRTGQGQFIDLSLVESMLPLTAVWALAQSANGRIEPRQGNRHPLHVPHGVFRCINKDSGEDQWIMVAVTGDAMWPSLCGVIGRDDLARDAALATPAGRRRREAELEAAITQWTQTQDADAAMNALQAAGVAAGVVRGAGDLPHEPQLQARGFWQHIERAHVGTHRLPSAPFRENDEPYSVTRPAPTLGQYNVEVLQGILGLSESDLNELTRKNVIGTLPILPEKRKVKAQSR